ncbi:PQQ-dependent sugar dehydrogenase [Shewanella sp. NIFS-20-20]|uniref:PQQ-dependent sugar dehydrogenase n=1 Tax=Shewanella sp. NIFS-20-20 TaxID=2853806 RepID=UPI001C47A6D5|nr:PQQ-dependent sugar dehydrogenase [Shewanella sp. NIFS-20-20]MBV7316367.1 PQQ-dependent sugar dehydrogenase [Shewanella sp. NIFS-20-20]
MLNIKTSLLALLWISPSWLQASEICEVIASKDYQIKVSTIATGLAHPWSMAFLPSAKAEQWQMLISERNGQLKRVDHLGEVTLIAGAPSAQQLGQGGLLGVAISPDFSTDKQIFIAYSQSAANGAANTAIARATLAGDELHNVRTIFSAKPLHQGGRHFGGRLAIRGQCLLLSLGDRGDREQAQDLQTHTGSLVAVTFAGLPCPSNPTFASAALAEIVSYGHRNIQGLTLDDSGNIWTHEHGPQGGDELNLIKPGANYGWPTITYGKNYGTGTAIGIGTERMGMQQPLYYWVPSIAPSGLLIYSGGLFSQWQGDVLLGSLKFGLLVRLQRQGDRIIDEERLLGNQFGRIRDVAQGPEGAIYLLTDSANGSLLKLTPYALNRHPTAESEARQ